MDSGSWCTMIRSRKREQWSFSPGCMVLNSVYLIENATDITNFRLDQGSPMVFYQERYLGGPRWEQWWRRPRKRWRRLWKGDDDDDDNADNADDEAEDEDDDEEKEEALIKCKVSFYKVSFRLPLRSVSSYKVRYSNVQAGNGCPLDHRWCHGGFFRGPLNCTWFLQHS